VPDQLSIDSAGESALRHKENEILWTLYFPNPLYKYWKVVYVVLRGRIAYVCKRAQNINQVDAVRYIPHKT